METTIDTTGIEELEMPEWAHRPRHADYKCTRCSFHREVTVNRQFVQPTIEEEHFNRWGYPCSNTTLTLQ